MEKSSGVPGATETQISKQYDLFTTFFGDQKNLSNTIDLWDAIPKYSVSARKQNQLRDKNGRLKPYHHSFQYSSPKLSGPIPCKMNIQPVSIEIEKGVFKDFFPSQNEEIIEEVLKKIFNDQQYGIHLPADMKSWVTFTLYMIQKELRSRGHTRSIDEIKRSLIIMSKCIIDIEMKNQQTGAGLKHTGAILADMLTQTREELASNPSAKWTARLPTLISQGINDVEYRQFNYAVHMRFSTPLARWLHKRLVHRYRNASVHHSYNLAFSTVVRDSNLLHHSRKSANVKTLDDTLEEFKENGILIQVDREEKRQGREIKDVVYKLYASFEFQTEVKAANKRVSEGREALAIIR